MQYRETKTGYECIHLPSIDISSIEPTVRNHGSHYQAPSSTSGETSPMTPIQSRPSIMKKTSKLSFGMKKDKGKEREATEDTKEKDTFGRPSGGTTLTTPSTTSSTFFNLVSAHGATHPAEASQTNGSSLTSPTSPQHDAASHHGQENSSSSPRSHSPVAHSTMSNKSKILPPIPRDFGMPRAPSPLPARSPSPLPTGEVDKNVFESMGSSSLSVRFEINIVKVY